MPADHGDGDGPEPLDSWDIDEILAPLPEVEVEGSTSVLPPAAEPLDEPSEPDQP